MCEDRELGPVYTSLLCTGQGQITRLQWAFASWHKDCDSQAPAWQGGAARARRAIKEFVMAARSLLDFTPETMARIFPPIAPWLDCWPDLLGPLPTWVSWWWLINYYSRFLEVVTMKSTTSAKAVEALAPMFATLSFPFSLRTHYGP